MRLFAEYVMRGRLQATSVAGLCGVLSWIFPPLSYISGATVALVALRLGPRDGFIIVLGTALLSVSTALVWLRTPLPAVALILAIWLPAWLCAQVLRITRSQGAMLLAIGILGGVFAGGMWVLTDDAEAWWREWLGRVLEQAQGSSGLNAELVDRVAPLMNGLMAAAVSLSLTITMLIARWWQAILYNPGGFRTEFQELRLPRLLAVPVVVAMALVLIEQAKGAGYGLITDLVLVASTLYFFQGLAVVHHHLHSRNQSTGWLVILYALLFSIPHYTYLALAMTGLADSFLDLRGPKPSDKGS